MTVVQLGENLFVTHVINGGKSETTFYEGDPNTVDAKEIGKSVCPLGAYNMVADAMEELGTCRVSVKKGE